MEKAITVTPQQRLALTLEIETAVRLLCLGLAELQAIDGANDFYHLPFLLVSSGFERLMKWMICVKRLNDTAHFPSTQEIKTHDLLDLRERVVRECISESTALQRPATRADYEYMTQDDDLTKLLSMLSEFGKFSRYYNLNVITGNIKPSVDVEAMWSEYELELVKRHGLTSLLTEPARGNELYRELTRLIVVPLERFARALARQFTLGDLGDEAQVHTGTIGCFLFLRDDELGKTDYRKTHRTSTRA